jgi:hypothetical protein
MGSNSLSIFKKDNMSPVNLEQTSFKDALNFVGQAPQKPSTLNFLKPPSQHSGGFISEPKPTP